MSVKRISVDVDEMSALVKHCTGSAVHFTFGPSGCFLEVSDANIKALEFLRNKRVNERYETIMTIAGARK